MQSEERLADRRLDRLAEIAPIDHRVLRNDARLPEHAVVLRLGEAAVDDVVEAVRGDEGVVDAAFLDSQRRLVVAAGVDDLGEILLQLRTGADLIAEDHARHQVT